MKIKLSQIAVLHAALASLDGEPQIVEDNNGKKSKALKYYQFSAKVTWNKRKNLGILRRKMDAIEEERKEKVKKFADKSGEQVAPENETEFNKEYNDLLNQEEEIDGLLQFSFEDLNLFDKETNKTGNNIPATILDALEPLIKEGTGPS